MLKGDEGFTIIEVTIFLGISGLLLLMMFIGTGSMASRQRFSDTTDSLLVYFQAQYDEVVNGVNVRSATSECQADSPPATVQPGKSQCLLLGKLLTISSDGKTIQSSYIVSTHSVTPTADDIVKLKEANLQVVANSQTTYELKWGAAIPTATRTGNPLSSTRQNINSIAFLRIPDEERIVKLYYYTASGNLTTGIQNAVLSDANALSPTGDTDHPSLAVCVKNDADFTLVHPRSAIRFSQGQGAGTIITDYSPGATLCPVS